MTLYYWFVPLLGLMLVPKSANASRFTWRPWQSLCSLSTGVPRCLVLNITLILFCSPYCICPISNRGHILTWIFIPLLCRGNSPHLLHPSLRHSCFYSDLRISGSHLNIGTSQHLSKTVLLLNAEHPQDFVISLDNSQILPSVTAYNFGVTMDASSHFTNLTQSCWVLLYNIRRFSIFMCLFRHLKYWTMATHFWKVCFWMLFDLCNWFRIPLHWYAPSTGFL